MKKTVTKAPLPSTKRASGAPSVSPSKAPSTPSLASKSSLVSKVASKSALSPKAASAVSKTTSLLSKTESKTLPPRKTIEPEATTSTDDALTRIAASRDALQDPSPMPDKSDEEDFFHYPSDREDSEIDLDEQSSVGSAESDEKEGSHRPTSLRPSSALSVSPRMMSARPVSALGRTRPPTASQPPVQKAEEEEDDPFPSSPVDASLSSVPLHVAFAAADTNTQPVPETDGYDADEFEAFSENDTPVQRASPTGYEEDFEAFEEEQPPTATLTTSHAEYEDDFEDEEDPEHRLETNYFDDFEDMEEALTTQEPIVVEPIQQIKQQLAEENKRLVAKEAIKPKPSEDVDQFLAPRIVSFKVPIFAQKVETTPQLVQSKKRYDRLKSLIHLEMVVGPTFDVPSLTPYDQFLRRLTAEGASIRSQSTQSTVVDAMMTQTDLVSLQEAWTQMPRMTADHARHYTLTEPSFAVLRQRFLTGEQHERQREGDTTSTTLSPLLARKIRQKLLLFEELMVEEGQADTVLDDEMVEEGEALAPFSKRVTSFALSSHKALQDRHCRRLQYHPREAETMVLHLSAKAQAATPLDKRELFAFLSKRQKRHRQVSVQQYCVAPAGQVSAFGITSYGPCALFAGLCDGALIAYDLTERPSVLHARRDDPAESESEVEKENARPHRHTSRRRKPSCSIFPLHVHQSALVDVREVPVFGTASDASAQQTMIVCIDESGRWSTWYLQTRSSDVSPMSPDTVQSYDAVGSTLTWQLLATGDIAREASLSAKLSAPLCILPFSATSYLVPLSAGPIIVINRYNVGASSVKVAGKEGGLPASRPSSSKKPVMPAFRETGGLYTLTDSWMPSLTSPAAHAIKTSLNLVEQYPFTANDACTAACADARHGILFAGYASGETAMYHFQAERVHERAKWRSWDGGLFSSDGHASLPGVQSIVTVPGTKEGTFFVLEGDGAVSVWDLHTSTEQCAYYHSSPSTERATLMTATTAGDQPPAVALYYASDHRLEWHDVADILLKPQQGKETSQRAWQHVLQEL